MGWFCMRVLILFMLINDKKFLSCTKVFKIKRQRSQRPLAFYFEMMSNYCFMMDVTSN
jgi:hypothetical protein